MINLIERDNAVLREIPKEKESFYSKLPLTLKEPTVLVKSCFHLTKEETAVIRQNLDRFTPSKDVDFKL